jgi:hypothetical protein
MIDDGYVHYTVIQLLVMVRDILGFMMEYI